MMKMNSTVPCHCFVIYECQSVWFMCRISQANQALCSQKGTLYMFLPFSVEFM
jgi:hypothetical protein